MYRLAPVVELLPAGSAELRFLKGPSDLGPVQAAKNMHAIHPDSLLFFNYESVTLVLLI